MKVQDIMSRYPTTVEPDDVLWLAAQKMVWVGIHHIPVTGPDGTLVGLLTERDLAVCQARDNDWSSVRTSAIMQRSPQTANPMDSVIEVTARMAAHRVDCFPVLELGKLVGIVTMTDILGAQVKNALQPLPAHGATVGDVMTKEVEVINVDDSLVYATERMKAKRIRHLPVLDDEGDLVGVLSDRDICAAFGDPVRALQAKPDEPGATSIRVEEAMSRPVMTTTPDRLCSQVARDFVAISASAFPVIDETGTLVGMLSYIDVLRGLAQTRDPS